MSQCALNLRSEGSTCVDNTATGFSCVCPPGKAGTRCEIPSVIRTKMDASESCMWAGRMYPNDSSWDDNCNRCVCRKGRTVCTRVWCGPKNCLAEPSAICGMTEVCVPTTREACFSPPCIPWGECRPLQIGRQVGLPSGPAAATCWPNLARLSPTCARLTLVLDRSKIASGFSVESLCFDLRKLAASQSGLWDSFQLVTQKPPLVVLCDLKENVNDVVEVTVVSLLDSFIS